MAVLDSSSTVESTPEPITTHDQDRPDELQSLPISESFVVSDTDRKLNLETENGNGSPKFGKGNGNPKIENGNGNPKIEKGNGNSNIENGNRITAFENGNGNPNLESGNQNTNFENGNRILNSSSFSSSVSSEGGNDQNGLHGSTVRELEDLFSKLNPHAKEFVPPSLLDGSLDMSSMNANKLGSNGNRKKKNGYPSNERRVNSRLQRAQRDDSVRRTVYVSDIDHQVTEEQLAGLFLTCGQVVDCRVCGDPNSVLRFAFVEFTDEEGARRALSLAGTMLGFYPVRVLPSKTAIIPVNPTFLPQSENEREMCARTIYCTNIDKKVSQAEVRLFFESICGEVARLRLLGDYRHSTRIAFVEFVMAESAINALNCSGAILGSLPIRVSPSKTPVRPCMTRPFFV